jgi:hypothetical protein
MLNLLDKENPLCIKAFLGFISGISLIINMFINPCDTSIYAVAALAAGSLAISGFEIFKKTE